MTSPATNDKPNMLIIMSDEHAPQFSGFHGHPLVQTPHMDRLAARGVLFENAYCNTPICVASRMSFLTGRYAHHNGAWDNSAPLASDAVTWPHLLRAEGYDVVLSGKQHFVGPDKLHGFRAQLARDLHAENAHPTFDWTDGTPPAPLPWPTLEQAGPGETLEIEIDDEVEDEALKYLRDPARAERPWALNVSFIAPHFPLIVPQKYWDMYPLDDIDLPQIPEGHLASQHPVYKRMQSMFGFEDFDEELVRRGRAGYYGLITYLDDKIGRLLDALDESGQTENTLVVYVSDHGEMNGEHGMWRKSNFYEQSARIPLMMAWPGQLPEGLRIPEVVSLVDLSATLVDVAGASSITPLDGESLLPLARSEATNWKNEAFAEYLAHGVSGPMAMLRRDRFKLNYSLGDDVELYDLEADPGEFQNLADDPEYQTIVDEMTERILSHWDPATLKDNVIRSQKERILIERATTGKDPNEQRQRWAEAGSALRPPA